MKAKSPYLEELRGSMKQGNDGITARMNMKGEIVIEKIPTHYDADTDLQETQRQAFKSAIAQWNALSDQEKEEWREKASPYGLTGYQYFLSQNISYLATYKVTIDNTGGASLSDYQILISINSDAVFFADCDSKKAAIRIYDSDQTTPLSYWIEEWDTENNNARIWVKVPTIPADGIKYIYISINPSRTTDASSVEDTFIDDISNAQLVYLAENGTGSVLSDLSGNAYNGTIYGATWTDGKHGKALYFDGSNDYVQIGDVAKLRFTASGMFTILAWIKTTDTGRGNVFGNYRSSSYPGINMEMHDSYNGNLRAYLRDASGNTKDWKEKASIANNSWHYIGIIYNNNLLKMYRDGGIISDSNILKTSNATLSGNLWNANGYRIGKDNRDLEGSPSIWYKGTIDELLVFDKDLSLTEINELYNNQAYATESYPNHVLVRKYAEQEPTVTYEK